MKTLSIATSAILSIVLWGFVLHFFVVNSGNLVIEEGFITKLPNSYLVSTYLHLSLLIFIAIYIFRKKTNYKNSIVFLSLLSIPSVTSLIALSLMDGSILNGQRYSAHVIANWNYLDIIFYFALYLKALNFVS
ncbi:hypothetical protein EHQ82_01565 [Leptospira selangorensis]|uniref:Uncharacterized protein n=1 Tax=Leptospira selangorensis TaxID=2484982 RepID=A0ABY2NI84_9LEPT|nr:hypothetical protein [Leptospira selangorensis]TGM27934.1 hypothetical protein EHQ82_01565 [Leptospira selangorensis]